MGISRESIIFKTDISLLLYNIRIRVAVNSFPYDFDKRAIEPRLTCAVIEKSSDRKEKGRIKTTMLLIYNMYLLIL
jgi:hypothetical protein